jgi:hypothetical protein
MDGAPGGMLTALGQENLCQSCHSAGKIAGSASIGAGSLEKSHPWNEDADEGVSDGPPPGSDLALHLDNGKIRCGTCYDPHENRPVGTCVTGVCEGGPFDGSVCKNNSECAAQVKFMREFGATALSCTPSYALHLAEAAPRTGVEPARLDPRAQRRRLQLTRALEDVEEALRVLELDGKPVAPPPATVSECARWARMAGRTRRRACHQSRVAPFSSPVTLSSQRGVLFIGLSLGRSGQSYPNCPPRTSRNNASLSTRFHSPQGRDIRCACWLDTAASSWGGLEAVDPDGAAVLTCGTRQFHSWQPGQRPSHLRLSRPQLWQT